jgi:PAS domain S-box-containing protein
MARPATGAPQASDHGPALASAILRQAAEAMIVCDRYGRIVLVNDAARRLACCELEGLDLDQIAVVWGEPYEGGRRVEAEETPLRRALRGEIQAGRELQIVRRDGVVQTLLISAAPVREQGAIVAAVASVSEITTYRKSEERYRALVEAVPIGVLRSNIAGDILGANDAFLEMMQLTRAEVENGLVGWRELTPPEYLPRDEVAIAEALKTGRCRPYEKAYVRKDGTIVPILIGYSMVGPKRDEAIAFILDLSERQAAEAALRESEQHLRDLLDNLFAFVGILDTDGVLLWANRAPLEAAGLTLEDVRGKRFDETLWWSYDPQVQARLIETIQRAARGEGSRYDIDVRMAHGRMLTIDFMISPLRNAEGQITKLVPSAVDITKRKASEEALRDSEARLHLAQEAGGIGVWDWDVATDRATWSASLFRLLGLEPKAKPQSIETFFAVLHPEDRDRVAAEIESALSKGSFHSEYRVIHPNGQVRWLAARGEIKMRSADGPGRMLGVAYDVTAQHRLLRQKEIMLREVNHRVKNSLQLVSSLLNLQHGSVDNEDVRRQLAEADRRILTIAKIHEHLYRGVEPISRIEFAGYLHDLCRELQTTVAGDSDIVVAVDADAVELPTDRVISLALIVNELVTNAAKYAFAEGQGGRIDVSFRAGADAYSLTVADRGRGLPEGYRIDDSKGLGMRVVSGLVRSMRAELDIGHNSPGTRFTISFPASASGPS